jgi:hypothetical protein
MLFGGLGLAACAAPVGSEYTAVQTGLAAFSPWRGQPARPAAAPPISRNDPQAECVPFAREVSGIDIVGDARTWWAQAVGRFDRTRAPAVGAVMAFRPHAEEMPLGHVAVVTAILDARTVLVAHRNWDGGLGKGRTSLDQPVRDISAAGDWSVVRVWHEGTRALGPNAWGLEGFIHRRPPGRLVAAL